MITFRPQDTLASRWRIVAVEMLARSASSPMSIVQTLAQEDTARFQTAYLRELLKYYFPIWRYR